MRKKRSRNGRNGRSHKGRQGKRNGRRGGEQGAFGYEGAAAYLDLGKSTLHALVASGEGPASVKVGRRRLFPRESLDEWLRDLRAAQAGD